jgi:hypothetical protein
MSTARDRQQQRAAKRTIGPPTGKQVDALADRAEESGCDRCGTRFAELLPYYICRIIPDGGFSVRCSDCCHAHAHPLLLAAYHGDGDPWSKDDRAWFATHPNRRWRMRKPIPGELAASAAEIDVDAFSRQTKQRGDQIAIVSFQAEVGKRIRRIVAIPTSDPPSSFTDAGIVRLFPGLADYMSKIASLPDAEWERYQLEKMRGRLDATAAVVRLGYRPWR